MKQFQIQTKILMDDTVENQLKNLPMKRAFVICDPFMQQNGYCSTLCTALQKNGVVCESFCDVIPDPSLEVVTNGEKKLMAFQPDTVIAIGGGSAIDTAKLVTHIYRNSHADASVCLIAVPTTSGTGTEVTSFSVVTDTEKQIKYALVDDAMLPDAAVLDPELIRTLPPAITADTGMDVLTHAMEAYVARDANDFTDAMAEKATRLVFDYLLRTVKNANDMEARKKMLHASCMAGNAFNTAGLGLNHAMAHALGAKFHMPHGRCNAWLLPHIIEYNAKDLGAAEKYRTMAAILRLPSNNTRIAVSSLITHIRTLRSQVGIDGSIWKYGVEKSAFRNSLAQMAETAQKDNCFHSNPQKPSKEDIILLYEKIID